jgi:hypothetical protein
MLVKYRRKFLESEIVFSHALESSALVRSFVGLTNCINDKSAALLNHVSIVLALLAILGVSLGDKASSYLFLSILSISYVAIAIALLFCVNVLTFEGLKDEKEIEHRFVGVVWRRIIIFKVCLCITIFNSLIFLGYIIIVRVPWN